MKKKVILFLGAAAFIAIAVINVNIATNGEMGLYAQIGSRKVKLGLGATAGGSVGIPDCVDSTGNCCIKTFINNSPVYY